MGDLENALEQLAGEPVDIYIEHGLFGRQHIHIDRFVPEVKFRKGFHCKDQIIYMRDNEIINYNIEKCKIVINGINSCIRIVRRT